MVFLSRFNLLPSYLFTAGSCISQNCDDCVQIDVFAERQHLCAQGEMCKWLTVIGVSGYGKITSIDLSIRGAEVGMQGCKKPISGYAAPGSRLTVSEGFLFGELY